MATYHRLSLTEREEVGRLFAAGCSLRATAQALHLGSEEKGKRWKP